ncbi:hypothetical protein HMPREF9621_02795 [Cutibacterium modestum HL037PA2]|uniref:Uncharacterized protein n=1 Tax=Cutibacterium modestum HL044PA1 TaxID=765109 RepID=A0ABP2K7S9_9ACTN|nr:hypothetical protein HMPREF9621_02795 [Cutibacterium modestum HL037PA2]EFS92983.1 hypothetical protein HMPREF9607_00834 [Cutibacterium modestum HL044PA1]
MRLDYSPVVGVSLDEGREVARIVMRHPLALRDIWFSHLGRL